MYNGIGLTTARGSGTNGYVQRNLAFVHEKKEKIKYRTESEIAKQDALVNRQPNLEILDHERKRKMELKCLELREVLEEQGFGEEEIETKLSTYRAMLVERSEKNKTSAVELDENGRPIARDTHELAAATQERNLKLRDAFGVTADFVEGSSFDPNRKAKSFLKEKEAKAKEMAEKNSRYGLVRSPSPEVAPEPVKLKESSPRHKHKKDKREKRTERSRKHRRHDSSSEDVSDIDRSDDERRDRSRKRHRHDKDKKRSEVGSKRY